MNDFIKNYIIEWMNTPNHETQGNDPEFIKHVIEFCKNSVPEQWEFEGLNGYPDYTASVYENSMKCGFGFEISYNPKSQMVKVFTSAHYGFYVKEYFILEGDDCGEMLKIIKSKLLQWCGFGSNND